MVASVRGLSATVPNRVRQSVNKSFYAGPSSGGLFFVNLRKERARRWGHQPGPNNRTCLGETWVIDDNACKICLSHH
jgi:hypothetical protein